MYDSVVEHSQEERRFESAHRSYTQNSFHMIPQIIKKAIIKVIKRRVLKCTQSFGDYENATSFIINAPMREWKCRLWLIENVREIDGTCCTDETLYKWLTHR